MRMKQRVGGKGGDHEIRKKEMRDGVRAGRRNEKVKGMEIRRMRVSGGMGEGELGRGSGNRRKADRDDGMN